VDLHDYLESLFGRKIDMVSVDFISPFLAGEISNDAILYHEASA